jgi:hypothetical protein
MDDPNSLGAYLAVALCIGLYAVSSRSGMKRVCYFGALAMVFTALLMSASRSAVGTAFLLIIVAPYFAKFAGVSVFPQETAIGRVIGKVSIAMMIAFVLLVGVAAYKHSSVEKPASSVDFVLTSVNPMRPVDAILKGRTALWQTAIRLFQRNPVFGEGPGSFFYTVWTRPYDFPELRIVEHVHNYYLQILAETGVAGLLLWLVILLTILLPAFARLRCDKPDPDTARIYGLVAGILVFLLTSFTGHPLLLSKMQYLFWSLAGLVLLSTRILEEQRIPYLRSLLTVLSIVTLLLFPWHIISAERSAKLSAYEIGYHPWERDSSQRLFRWTRDLARSDLLVEGDVLSFQIRQINKEFLQKPWPVDIYLNDRLAERVFLKDSRWKPLEYNLHSKQGSRIHLAIKPASTFSPVIRGLVDARKLGVQITPFWWKCQEDSPRTMLEGIARADGKILRISSLPLSKYSDPHNIKVVSLNGTALLPNPALSSIFSSSFSSAPLYHAQFTNPEFTIDSGTNLVIKKDFPSGNAVFRIAGVASCKTSAVPVLFISRNGKQTLKIPFLCSTLTDYYFELPLSAGVNELTFSAWDGLSEVTTRAEMPIRIREVRIWSSPGRPEEWLRRGWFEAPGGDGQILLDPAASTPVGLVQTGDSFDVEKDWNSGAASLVITADANAAGKELPRLGIYSSGRVGSIEIQPGGVREYRVEIPLAGRQRLQLVFENDFYDAARNEDRNIVLYGVRMEFSPSLIVMDTIDDFLLSGPPCYAISGPSYIP